MFIGELKACPLVVANGEVFTYVSRQFETTITSGHSPLQALAIFSQSKQRALVSPHGDIKRLFMLLGDEIATGVPNL
jgi:hypothetical protein